jgi:hypothetical protein
MSSANKVKSLAEMARKLAQKQHRGGIKAGR